MSKTKQLRFAGLVRVSGEAQAKHGESLRTQHGQLENAVGQMQARVTRWYEGQEHATPGHERQLLEQMLKDAAKAKSPFDAIVVADPTRWTRDNQRGDSGLDHLRQHGIRFFVLSQEFNLYDPVHRFMLQQFASFGELSAALNLQKAMDNRIARAKRNVPTNGSLPWGRTFDRATETWGIDEEKQRIIKDIAARYIRGESRVKLAAEYGLEQTGLHDVLTKKCGSEWPIQFMCKRLNIDEEVMLTIPALLPATTRKAILRRAEKNRTSDHGHIKHKYLLSRMVFCGHCGGALSGGCPRGRRVYRHYEKTENCLQGQITAERFEEAVLRQMFEMFGNPKSVAAAVERATPNLERLEECRKRRTRVATELDKLVKGRDRIVRMIRDGTLKPEHAKRELEECEERETLLANELDSLEEELGNVPDKATVEAVAKQIAGGRRRGNRGNRKINREKQQANRNYDSMSWDEKRELCQIVFGGKLADGRRMGVYVERIEGQPKHGPKDWKFHIHGNLIDEWGGTAYLDDMLADPEHKTTGAGRAGGAQGRLGSPCRVR